jgi:hypothetical protein
LSALAIEDIKDASGVIVVRARTPGGAVACPGCGTQTGRVHGYHERTTADVPVDGRRVVVRMQIRRMRCPVTGCARQTFREQVPGVLDGYQRRTAARGHPAGARPTRPPASAPGCDLRRPGYDHDKDRCQVRDKGITPVIARSRTEHGSGLGVHRWVAEPPIALLHWFRRLRIRWETRDGIHEAFLSLACAIICWRRLANASHREEFSDVNSLPS